MLSRATVLVLGAGASAPFGFPTGVQLSKLLFEELQQGRPVYNSLRNHLELSGGEIAEFRDAFFYSGKNSIDAFLEHRTEYLSIGKAATAAALMAHEHTWHLFRYGNENWLRYLYNNLNASFEKFGSNKLSIVTFNYDRSVEHFLFSSLKNSYGKSDDECRAALETIPVIHLHGRLGHLPWQRKDGRPFDVTINRELLRIAADGIKIVHEDISDGRDKDFERAKELMQSADQIFFWALDTI